MLKSHDIFNDLPLNFSMQCNTITIVLRTTQLTDRFLRNSLKCMKKAIVFQFDSTLKLFIRYFWLAYEATKFHYTICSSFIFDIFCYCVCVSIECEQQCGYRMKYNYWLCELFIKSRQYI